MAVTESISTKGAVIPVLTAVARRMVAARPQRRRVLAGAALEGFGIALGIIGPVALQRLVDGLTTHALSVVWIAVYVLLFALSWAGTSVSSAARVVYSTRIIDEVTGQLVGDALRAHLPAAATARDGDSARTLGLVERLPYSLLIVGDGLIWRAGPLVIQFAATLAVLASMAPMRYVVALAAASALYVLVTRLGSAQHMALSNQTNAALADVSQTTGDVLRNARRVVLNGALDVELDGIAAGYGQRATSNQRLTWSLVRLTAYQYGSLASGLVLLLGMAGGDVMAGRLTAGELVLLQAFALRLILPLSGFAFVLSQAAVSLGNIRDVLDLSLGQNRAGTSEPVDAGAAAISLQAVQFRYGSGLSGLVDISAEIAPGAFTVIVGPNGSGKSTLAQLLAGLLEPASGVITINNRDLRDIPKRDRHRHILYVPQFIGLFNRSLGANALYPPTVQSEDDLARLLNQWNFYEAGRDIDFGVPVGEQGERLSGGQVQKLELARVAGVKVPAIILDESTSALDPASEAAVISELRYRFGLQTTLIVISHRQQLAEAADQVLFLSAGRLQGAGLHRDLCKRLTEYRALWGED